MLKPVLRELKANVDTEYRIRIRDYFGMDVSNFLGVPTPVVRRISARSYRDIKPLPIADVFRQCETLLESGVYECRIIAFDWSYRRRSEFEAKHFKVFERWLRRYVDDWSDCDDLCLHPLGCLIAQHPAVVDKVVPWTRSKTRWLRRAAAVSLIYGLRRGQFAREAFGIAGRLLTDQDDLVQKGYGWMLKEAGKQYPNEVFEFVTSHSKTMPRTALRYAIEKFPEHKRRQVLKKQRY